jgi:ribosomal protein S18 acetylase RimI-like enzyme
MVEIELFDGPRRELDALFAEADDSESEIADYRDLGVVLVARQDGKVIGQALVVETGEPGEFELKSLAVAEECRSGGIGSALVQAAIRHCRARDARVLLVATAAASIGALQFYQRQGFRFRRIIRDFYSPERGYRPLDLNGIPLRDEIILDLMLQDG